MKIAVIGAGSIGKRHLRNLCSLAKNEGISEVRCYEQNQERSQDIKNELNEILIFNSLDKAVKDTDLVFLCVPTGAHFNVWEKIKNLGDFNYFIEKPLSHSFKNCDEMIFHQKKINKRAFIGYMLRLHPVLNEAKRLLGEEVIGDVLNVRAESGFYLPFWHPWEDYRNFYMAHADQGGGALLDESHGIDLLRWLFGEIQSLSAYVGKVIKDDCGCWVVEEINYQPPSTTTITAKDLTKSVPTNY